MTDHTHNANLEDTTMTDRMTTNMTRATEAVQALQNATTDEERLAAAKALESAACQLRRELKKATA